VSRTREAAGGRRNDARRSLGLRPRGWQNAL